MFYDYNKAMSEDLIDYVADNYNVAELLDALEDPESFKETLNDNCWIDDGVTGNASGSYTFNSYKAQEYVTDNIDLCREALREFCTDADTIADHFLNGDWEYFDVTIRCYILYGEIDTLVDALVKCKDAIAAAADTSRDTLIDLLSA